MALRNPSVLANPGTIRDHWGLHCGKRRGGVERRTFCVMTAWTIFGDPFDTTLLRARFSSQDRLHSSRQKDGRLVATRAAAFAFSSASDEAAAFAFPRGDEEAAFAFFISGDEEAAFAFSSLTTRDCSLSH
jgi:hypothetical protein